MAATLAVQLSEETYDSLLRQSALAGKTPEELASEYISGLLSSPQPGRLRRWAGVIASGVSDASVRHDEYLGHVLFDELGERQGHGTIR